MTRKHYVPLARMMGDGLAIAALGGGETSRSEFYNEVFCPLVTMLAEDNPNFDRSRFAYATAQAESKYLDLAAEHSGRIYPEVNT